MFLLLVSFFKAVLPRKNDLLKTFLEKNGIDNVSFLAVVVVPLEGCTPCIKKTIEYAKTEYNDNVIFILETFGSAKNVTTRFSEEELNNNFIIDYNDYMVKNRLAITNPVIYLMKQKIVQKIPVTDYNFDSSIEKLSEFLLSEK